MQVQVESSLGQRYESLVTENGGYFQLKAGPGVWNLSLLGRANELFEIESPKSMIVNQFSGGNENKKKKWTVFFFFFFFFLNLPPPPLPLPPSKKDLDQ